MAAAISSSISRTKRKNTLMAIKQSTKFISKAFGAIDANSSLDERKIFSKDQKLHIIKNGPYKVKERKKKKKKKIKQSFFTLNIIISM